jgi:hypothetical protein
MNKYIAIILLDILIRPVRRSGVFTLYVNDK